jgi:hypothetical protein
VYCEIKHALNIPVNINHKSHVCYVHFRATINLFEKMGNAMKIFKSAVIAPEHLKDDEALPTCECNDDWIDDPEPVEPMRTYAGPLYNIVPQFLSNARQGKVIPSFDGRTFPRGSYEMFRSGFQRYEMNWRIILEEQCALRPEVTEQDKREAQQLIYAQLAEEVEHHLEAEALDFYYRLVPVEPQFVWPALYTNAMLCLDARYNNTVPMNIDYF